MSMISEKDALNIAKEVIVSEVSAINSFKKTLDKKLYLFCDKIFKSNGKLIIIGVGKSGHIGNKLAATFSSTGTPSFFIHPKLFTKVFMNLTVSLIKNEAKKSRPEYLNCKFYTQILSAARRAPLSLSGLTKYFALTLLLRYMAIRHE